MKYLKLFKYDHTYLIDECNPNGLIFNLREYDRINASAGILLLIPKALYHSKSSNEKVVLQVYEDGKNFKSSNVKVMQHEKNDLCS